MKQLLLLLCLLGTTAYGQVYPGGSDRPIEHWQYATAAARTGDTTLFAQDIGKIAYQKDTHEYWRLIALPATWENMNKVGLAGGLSGQVLTKASNTDYDFTWTAGGGGGGSTTFLGLLDVPDSYAGQAGKFVAVNGAATAVEFVTAPSGGAVTSVFTRTGAVVAATNDYTFAQIGSKPTTLGGYGITDGITAAAAAAAYQPLDTDLTTIAGLTATTDNFIVGVASAWASRTPTQVKTTLGLTIGTNVQAWDTDLDQWALKAPYAGTLTITTGKTVAFNNSMTLAAANDTSTLNIGTGGTLGTAAFTAASAYQPAGSYLTANQPISLTGDITGGPAATSIATTYNNVVPTAKGGAPTGGTTGQVLKKVDNANYNYSWQPDATAGGATWGSITGTLSSQTDLQTALDGKQTADADLTTYAGVTPTTVGLNFIDLANPTAIRFPKITAGNDVVAEDAPTFRSSIGAQAAGSYQAPLTFAQSLTNAANTVTFTNDSASPGASQYYGTDAGSAKGWFALPNVNSFGTIVVAGQSNVVGDAAADTLTYVAGTNMTITTNAATDTITFTAAGGGGTADDTAYSAAWNGSTAVSPSQNAVYDEMELRYPKTGGALSGAVSISMASPSITLNPVSGSSVIDLRGTASTNDGIRLSASGTTGSYLADTQVFKNRANSVTYGTWSSTGLAMALDITVPDEAYAAGWDGSLEVPTKNAVYDRSQTLQPLDTDLTTLAGITGVRGDILYYSASGWAKLGGGTDGFQLTTHSTTADPTWAAAGSGGGGTPGGSDTQVQFNDAGAFGGDADMIWNKTTNKLEFTGGATSDSRLRVGTLEFQPYALNNSWFGENLYYNAGFKYRATGAGGLFYFMGDEGQFRFFASGTAGNNTSDDNAQLKINADGTVAMGGEISPASGSESGARFIVDTSGSLRTASNFAFAWSGTSNDASGTVDTSISRNAAGVVEVNNGTAGQYRDLYARNVAIQSGGVATGNGTVPTGGTTGQVLAKNTNTNYDVGWVTGGGGGDVTMTGTQTLSNKRITPRITTITSSYATPTVNTDNADAVTITGLNTPITNMSTNLSGTPGNFDKLIYRIKDDGTARAIAWGTSFVSSQSNLPSTTVAGKVVTVGLLYDSVKAKWVCVSTDIESLTPAILQTANLTPTGTTSTSYVMAGMGTSATITPTVSGRIAINVSGNLTNTSTGGIITQLRYGTGTAPANGAADTGTAIGNLAYRTSGYAANQLCPFSITVIVSGLTVGTTYWIDCAFIQSTPVAGTSQLYSTSISAIETP